MARDVKISEVQEATPRRWEFNGKWNLDYKVKVEGSDDWLVLTQQEGGPHPRPTVGQDLFAEIDDSPKATKDGQFPAKLKRAKQGFGGGGGFDSPEKQKAIFMQHAQKEAHRILTFLHGAGLTSFADTKDYWQKFDMTVEILHRKAGQ